MSVLVQRVSTGDVIVFDKETRELVIVAADAAKGIEDGREMSVSNARRMEGANYFDREALQRVQAALAGVVLLV